MPFTPSDLFSKVDEYALSRSREFAPYIAIVQTVVLDEGYAVLRKEDDTPGLELPALVGQELKIGQRVLVQPMPDGFDVILGEISVVPRKYPRLTRAIDHRLMEVYADGNAPSFSTIGMPAPTVVAPGGMSVVNVQNQSFVTLDTGGVTNQDGKLSTSFFRVQPEWKPSLWVRYLTWNNVIDQRIWIGFFNADPMSSSAPNLHIAAFRFTAGTDTNWRCVTGNGSTRTAEYGSSPVVGPSNVHDFRIDLTSTEAVFWVDGLRVNTITTNLPAVGQGLGIVVGLRTLDGNPRRARISRLAIAHP